MQNRRESERKKRIVGREGEKYGRWSTKVVFSSSLHSGKHRVHLLFLGYFLNISKKVPKVF
jgi:hypothetical protein